MVNKNSNGKTVILSLLVMALWGSLFPMVKIGYDAFSIAADSIPDILMFACLFGAVLLGENIFRIQYLLAFLLICAGILLGNKSEASK